MGGIMGGGGGPSSAEERAQRRQEKLAAEQAADLRKKDKKELRIENSLAASKRAGLGKPQTLQGSLLGHEPSNLGNA